MFNLSKKYRVCRFYNEDLWGHLRTRQKLTNTFIQFVKQYKERKTPISVFSKTVVIRKQRRRSFYGEVLFLRKKLSYFYGGAKSSLPRWNHAQEQVLHLFSNSTLTWEAHLSSVVYRSNFSSSILGSISLVLSGGVLVNKKVVIDPSYRVLLGEIVEIVESRKEVLYLALLKRLESNRIAVFQPPYLEISVELMSSVLLYNPELKELHYPFSTTI